MKELFNAIISVGEPETGAENFLQGNGAGKKKYREPEPVLLNLI